MIVLGVDPGVRKLGYAVVDFTGNQKVLLDSGILFDDAPTTTRSVRYEKIHHISLFFNELFEKYTISRMGIEKLYFTSRNQSNAEFVYGIRAIIIDKALTKDILIKEIDPVQVKKYISGNGKASKELVQSKIMQLYNLQNLPAYNDSADALGMAWIAKMM